MDQLRRALGELAEGAPSARVTSGDTVEVTDAQPSTWLLVACLDPDLDGCADVEGSTFAVDPDEPTHRVATVHFADEDAPATLQLRVEDPRFEVGDTGQVDVVATNALGDRVGAGVTITLDGERSAPPGAGGSPLGPTTAQTNASGVASFTVGSDVRADDDLAACVDTGVGGCQGALAGEVTSPNLVISWRVSGDADLIGTTPATARVAADEDHAVLLQAFDGFGASATEGRPITEEVHRSTDGGATFARIATNARTVGPGGERTVVFPGPGAAAVDVMLWCNAADCGDVGDAGQVTSVPGAGVASVSWVVADEATGVSFGVRDLTRATGTSVEVDVAVTGAFGDPVPDTELLVEVYRDGDDVAIAGPALTTDGGGLAVLTLTGPDVDADDAVWVCVDADEDGTCTDDQLTGDDPAAAPLFVTWSEPGEPTTLTLAPRRVSRDVGTELVITAELRDAVGVEVPATPVRVQVFDIAGGPPTVVLDEAVTTDDDGVATTSVTGPVAETRWAIAVCTDRDGDDDCVVVDGGRLVRDPDEVVGARGIVRWRGLT